MGVTIHFEGKLKPNAYEATIANARAFAEARGWPVVAIEPRIVKLARVRDEKDWDYVGPVHGIEIAPHASAEPLRLEFDGDMYVQEYIKTQFAPVETHVEVTELLKQLERHFERLIVVDEGEYFESRDMDVLERHRQRFFEVFDEHMAKGGVRGPIRLPSGRIADLIEK